MTGLLLALAAAYGSFLVYTAIAFGWRGVGLGPAVRARPVPSRFADRLARAGLGEVRLAELATVTAVLFLLGAVLGFAIFGAVVPTLAAGVLFAGGPVAAVRTRRERRRRRARDGWPRMIEEIRIQVASLGRSIPQALFDVGRRGPRELRPAFAAAHREWLLSTNFARTASVLKTKLADPTADATCETLLIAHEVGGTDVDRRLAALVEDRVQDLQGRKDALSKQAGVRFARRFVLIVPLGMAFVGLSIGDGRDAYRTSIGQIAVVVALAMVGVCWLWAGRIMRLPEEQRVFYE